MIDVETLANRQDDGGPDADPGGVSRGSRRGRDQYASALGRVTGQLAGTSRQDFFS